MRDEIMRHGNAGKERSKETKKNGRKRREAAKKSCKDHEQEKRKAVETDGNREEYLEADHILLFLVHEESVELLKLQVKDFNETV
jgi:hypothetical protein